MKPLFTPLGRRTLLGGLAAGLLSACSRPSANARGSDKERDGGDQLAALQSSTGGMLGAYILDTQSQKGFGINEAQRFPHCSSFKLSLAALILQQADKGNLDLDERIHYTEADLMFVSPVTTRNLEKGMTLEELAKATQTTSDNAAANILLHRLGGPEVLTGFWRSIGDSVSRLDKTEPALNKVEPGAVHDTTTPQAMAHTLSRLLTGDVLSDNSRAKLWTWMQETRTGLDRIRAGLPQDWSAGDKTGTFFQDGVGSTYVDIAFVRPPDSAPLAITAYYRTSDFHKKMEPETLAILAKIGEIAHEWVA
ncbi:class A beta-lactamase [Altericroceibacterium spongiae]|uniref:beta-lactamase n=1 Tax=Altericroceibacterium spongiae TaxID=2320269 RepID=A0A420EC05_9SPHN|nr:class A beta-lactamase [Altericroceibacterium spongiae]RKF18183.1 class A beta-lactamase [Altericroceibacterium spongiae]